ncbi:hypothetical protein GP5015_28 [gamma proteobacterium HTCC5015]|nr:hypothetical protein GP5015_28 [gamma proteobacterium HTCC5015]
MLDFEKALFFSAFFNGKTVCADRALQAQPPADTQNRRKVR